MNYPDEPIKTKLIIEVEPARFFSLGFGNITNSEANVVCVSSFLEDLDQTVEYFTSVSSILFGDTGPSQGEIITPVRGEVKAGYSYLFDLPEVDFGFRRLIVVCKGTPDQPPEAIATNIRIGLARAMPLIGNLGTGLQLDTTAMGVGSLHGGVNSKTAFGILSQWITDMFSRCKNVDHVRLVSNVPDTFVDLFESLHTLRGSSSALSFTTIIDPNTYGDLSNDIVTAMRLLHTNPKQVIVICRTIIESVVRKLCYKYLKRPPVKLYRDITNLKDAGFLPAYIFSYLHTCRVLGNFSNHTDFIPSSRDAEAVMLLTLRVVEWFLDSSVP